MAKRGGFPGGMPGNMNNLMKQAQKNAEADGREPESTGGERVHWWQQAAEP